MEDSTGSNRAVDVPCWYVIYTHPRQEERAEQNLNAWGVTTFNPKVKKPRFNWPSSPPAFVSKHLFPRYIFARFNAGTLIHKVLFTRGVVNVVNFGSGPARVDDEVIAFIRAQVRDDGLIDISEELKHGDKVIIGEGAFKDFAGVFEREMDCSSRVRILLSAISYQANVVVERGLVRKVV